MTSDIDMTDIEQRVWRQYEIYRQDIPEMADLLLDARNEISSLRAIVRCLHISLGPLDSYPWMKHSPADEAFHRALGTGRELSDDEVRSAWRDGQLVSSDWAQQNDRSVTP